ncbi:hypothetical protein G3D33_000363 [Salmonella enterica subsp. salamae]|nr:hypothetical protein [Salmonella enterica subsp. salamae]
MKSDDRLLFLGNPQQSVPKRLLLARNLSPREKFTWQLFTPQPPRYCRSRTHRSALRR